MQEITKRQKQILDFIANYIESNQYPPSIIEIADTFSINLKTAHEFLDRLANKGYIIKEKRIARSLLLTEKAISEINQRKIPIYGSTAAGKPIEAIEDIKGEIIIDKRRFSDGEYYALVVKGDSMKDAGIFDQDYVIVKKTEIAKDKDIVVALIDGDVTLKRIFYDYNRHMIVLHPENSAYSDIIVSPESFTCLGIVVGVQRYLE
ncbi:MAG: transcriptional repressor LexA [Exilispira sp.]|jgi:repressor LexA|nr:transcriptional repressor LexA [Exilispira sp.]